MLAQDDRLATRVGAVALFVLAGAIAFFVFVYGRIEWGDHVRVRVYFHQVAGLHEGAPIVVGGRSVGAVESIALVPAGAEPLLGDEEGVAVTVSLAARAAGQVPRGGDVFLASRGPFSERYLEIGPAPPPRPGAELSKPIAEGDKIRGTDPPSLDRVLQRTWDNLQMMSRFLDDVRPELTELRAQLATLTATLNGMPAPAPLRDELLTDVGALVAEARRGYTTGLGGDAGLARMRATIALARTTLAEVRATVADLDARAQALRAGVATLQTRAGAGADAVLDHVQVAIDRARAAIAKIDPLLAAATDLADRFERGEGTIGKIMHDPEFPEDAKELGKILKRQPWKIIGHPPD